MFPASSGVTKMQLCGVQVGNGSGAENANHSQLNVLYTKKEASAGSGGTAVNALAGGGNQSLLTVLLRTVGGERPS